MGCDRACDTACIRDWACVTGRAFVTRGVTWRARSRSQGLQNGFISTISTPCDRACPHHVTAPHTRSHAVSQMHSASHPMSQCTPCHTPCHGPSPQGEPPCRVHHIAPHLPLAGHNFLSACPVHATSGHTPCHGPSSPGHARAASQCMPCHGLTHPVALPVTNARRVRLESPLHAARLAA